MTVTRILLIGANGRMGQAISESVKKEDGFEIAASCGRGDEFGSAAGGCDVVIDFSQPDATEALCRACVEHKKPIVIGTTGHSAEQTGIIKTASANVPIVLAPNFSIGVNALFWLTRRAAGILGNGFDVEIVETHHRMKKDAPSGTAKMIAEILREEQKAPRETPIQSIREGELVGDHTVIFSGAEERLELTHRAVSREIFALGALWAAKWIVNRPPGLYSMQTVLGL